MDNITLWVAFAAGVLSFMSPCVFPLVPAYVSHLTGATVEGGRIDVNKKLLLIRSLFFIAGFSAVFIAMGTSASLLGRFFAEYRELISKLSGLLIVVFGLQMAGLLNFRILMGQKNWESKRQAGGGNFVSFMVGLAFGTGWTPCVGLALSGILLLAGSSDTMWSGALMLLIYSIGMGIPFLIISLMITWSVKFLKKINRWLPLLTIINGWIFIVMGALLFTGQLQRISAYLARFTFFGITL
ncbi:cytochrome c biogenesis CcdA family protein [Paenibacillus sp. FJAT-26967]|uniref:cytochrome c biogenesis CcdA family protein n=1 Tax=Paenibacillus sp. FJAT-26967 TaxID=1729690 RepID=UPI000A07AFB3|nr:cytochrome c biogenesis protein CcdA [Paenibacillus sp. FJAT-26967]